MKKAFFVFTLFLSELFLTICSFLGFEYAGNESSSMFTIVILLAGALSFIILLYDTNKELRTSFFPIFVVLLPILLLINTVMEDTGSTNESSTLWGYFKIAIGYILPICVTAIYIAKDGLRFYSKEIHVAMLLITIATFLSIRNSVADISLGFGGASYQTLAYYAALAFCLNLCYILYNDDLDKFKIFNAKWYYYFSYLLLVIQIAACLISGGRGGFVYLAVCSTFMLLRTGKMSKLFSVLAFGITLLIVVNALGPNSRVLDIISSQSERTFSYITKSGIDMTETSERDLVYDHAVNYIKDNLFMGGGVFGYRIEFGGYPHNFFLEVLMQGGILFLLCWIYILFLVSKKMHVLMKNQQDFLLLPIALYPATMLLFSGTYLWTPVFWFVIVYCFTRTELLKKRFTK